MKSFNSTCTGPVGCQRWPGHPSAFQIQRPQLSSGRTDGCAWPRVDDCADPRGTSLTVAWASVWSKDSSLGLTPHKLAKQKDGAPLVPPPLSGRLFWGRVSETGTWEQLHQSEELSTEELGPVLLLGRHSWEPFLQTPSGTCVCTCTCVCVWGVPCPYCSPAFK